MDNIQLGERLTMECPEIQCLEWSGKRHEQCGSKICVLHMLFSLVKTREDCEGPFKAMWMGNLIED